MTATGYWALRIALLHQPCIVDSILRAFGLKPRRQREGHILVPNVLKFYVYMYVDGVVTAVEMKNVRFHPT